MPAICPSIMLEATNTTIEALLHKLLGDFIFQRSTASLPSLQKSVFLTSRSSVDLPQHKDSIPRKAGLIINHNFQKSFLIPIPLQILFPGYK